LPAVDLPLQPSRLFSPFIENLPLLGMENILAASCPLHSTSAVGLYDAHLQSLMPVNGASQRVDAHGGICSNNTVWFDGNAASLSNQNLVANEHFFFLYLF
jgi:hypothetical protein